MQIKVKPYEHQQRAFDFVLKTFEKSNGASILAEMGCGKSLITVAIAGYLAKENKIRKMLIVCPLSVCGVWEEEFLKFADFIYNLKILKGSAEKKAEILKILNGEQLQVAVVNYESVWRLEKQIKNWSPSFIVCDKSHKIKSHELGFADELMQRSTATDEVPMPQVSMMFSRTAVVNSLIDKLAAKCKIEAKPTQTETKVKAESLMDRLNIIKNWR